MFPIAWLQQLPLMLNALMAAVVDGLINARMGAAVLLLLRLVLMCVHWYTLVAAFELRLFFVH